MGDYASWEFEEGEELHPGRAVLKAIGGGNSGPGGGDDDDDTRTNTDNSATGTQTRTQGQTRTGRHQLLTPEAQRGPGVPPALPAA